MLETNNITSIEQALAALGITDQTLNRQQQKTLDEQGFLLLPAVLDRAWLAELRSNFDRLISAAGTNTGQERGTRHIGGLLAQGPAFERMFVLPELLAAVYQILGREFHL